QVNYLEKTHGWLFEREKSRVQTADSTARCAVCTRYWLDKAVIAWAGTEGQEYAMKVLKLDAEKVATREGATSFAAETQSDKPNNLKDEHNIGMDMAQAVLEGSHHG
ncbi:MAG TPA: hypothetical protein PK129_17290, partial [Cellvibrionaceae bacterium]|nr:hypothetical protein [Cellvibrionaceae bacterium]